MSRLLFPRRLRTVPTGKQQINWQSRLANGLMGAWLPGLMGGIDVSGQTLDLINQGGGIFQPSQEGMGIYSTTSTSGFYNTAPLNYKSWTQFSLYWRGYIVGSPPSYANFLGVTYDNTGSSAPYTVAQLSMDGGGELCLAGADGAGFTSVVIASSISTPGLFSLGGTIVVGGNCYGYKGGVQKVSGTNWINAPNYTTTSCICINCQIGQGRDPNGYCTMAAIWNRALSADEMAYIDAYPYDLFVPVADARPVKTAAAAFAAKFRKTLSHIGTRIGDRQIQG